MNADDIDPRPPGEGQSAQAPAEPAPEDPSQEPLPSAQSPRPLRSIGWEGVLSTALVIVGRPESATKITKTVRERLQTLTDSELSEMGDLQSSALALAEKLATTTLLETFDWTSLRSYVFPIAKALGGADDIVQVVRQKVGRMTAAEWRGIANRNEHIYRMAYDQAMDWLAEEKRQREAAKRLKEAHVPDHDAGNVATPVFAGPDTSRVLRQIKQPRVREAFILRKQDGLSAKEIAKIMGISDETVKEYLAKAAEQSSTLDGRHRSKRERARPTGSTQCKEED